jgi:hypothetical protein
MQSEGDVELFGACSVLNPAEARRLLCRLMTF